MGHRLTSKPVPGDFNGICNAIARLDNALNSSASPEFASLALSGLTANALMYADSNGILMSLAAATNGQLIIGNTETGYPSIAALTGTANQVVVTPGAGSITLSTPQNIDTTADVQFGSAGITNTATVGRLLAGGVTE